MTETIYDEAPWLFLHNCGEWNLTSFFHPTKNAKACASLTEKALEWKLRPGLLCGEDKPSFLLENLLWQTEGLEKPRLCLQGVCDCCLADNQGGESHARVAAASSHFLTRRGKHPGPAHSTSQPAARSGQRFSLATQNQTRSPGVWSRWSHRGHCAWMGRVEP